LSNDPLGLGAGSFNLRAYVSNSPTNGADPSGDCLWFLIAAGFALGWELPDLWDWYQLQNSWHITPAKNDFGVPAQQYGDSPLMRERTPAGGYKYYSNNGPKVGDPPNAGPGGGTGTGCPCGCPPQGCPPTGGNAGPGGGSHSPGAFDPNELIGPAGSGTQGYVTGQQVFPYTIGFENDPKKATVAAQDVTVTIPLDPNLDWSTFQLGDIQFGATTISVPIGVQS
jgi:hypothetical protein